MGLQPTGIRFSPEDPLPASRYNSIVHASVEVQRAFVDEQGERGDHPTYRFAQAGALLEWTGTAWRLASSDGVDSVGGSLAEPAITLARPMFSGQSRGVIANDAAGAVVAEDASVAGADYVRLQNRGSRRMITVHIFGLVDR